MYRPRSLVYCSDISDTDLSGTLPPTLGSSAMPRLRIL
jgi:hypothetical protein